MKDPAFLFYSSDFLSGVADLTMEERGQFITLLCLQHQKGSLSEKTIRLSVGSCSVDVLKKFLQDEEGNFYNERLNIEAEKRNKFTESRRNNGLNGGRPLKNSIKVPKKDEQWKEMLRFFNNSCIDCGCKFTLPDKPTKDHIIPTISGGVDNITNWQPLCRQCNASKCADHSTDFRLNFLDQIPDKYKTIWFIEKNHMGNENENENRKDNNKKDIDFTFCENSELKPILIRWLEYKKWKGQRYKGQDSVETMFKKLCEYSNNDPTMATEIIEDAIAKNYTGFFKPTKNTQNGNTKKDEGFKTPTHGGFSQSATDDFFGITR